VLERAARLSYVQTMGKASRKAAQRAAYESHRPLLDAAASRKGTKLKRALRDHHESHLALIVAALAPSER
jgi:DNA-binding GntR family transcriptional regulator